MSERQVFAGCHDGKEIATMERKKVRRREAPEEIQKQIFQQEISGPETNFPKKTGLAGKEA